MARDGCAAGDDWGDETAKEGAKAPPRREKIVKRMVDALQPGAALYIVWDTQVPGFGVSVSSSGKKSYVYRYRVGGGRGSRSRQYKIGRHGPFTPDAARAEALALAVEVAHGGDPAAQRASHRAAPTMTDLFTRYLTDHAETKKKASSLDDDRSMIGFPVFDAHGRKKPDRARRCASLLESFGHMKVADVSADDIASWHAAQSSAKIRANRCVALLSKAFNLAIVWSWRPCKSNPAKLVEPYREMKRTRYLSPAEWRRLGQALADADEGRLRFRDGTAIGRGQIAAIRVLALSGARKSEILNLEWSHIDWEAECARLPDSKTGVKSIYLALPALDVIRGIDRRPGARYLFPSPITARPITELRDSWKIIREAAEISDVRLHDLRHSFASVGISSGLTLGVIGAILGHASPATTARYAHLAEDGRKDSTGQIAGRIDKAWSVEEERPGAAPERLAS